jgi:hypothetical protein
MPYLFPLGPDGKPTTSHGLIDLDTDTNLAGVAIRRLVYDIGGHANVSIEARKNEKAASFGTAASLRARAGLSEENLEEFIEPSSAYVEFTDFGLSSNRAVRCRTRMVISLDTVGSGSPSGKVMLRVWAEPRMS